jgi:hypothetical protein
MTPHLKRFFPAGWGASFGAESVPPQMANVNTTTNILQVLQIEVDCVGNCSPMKAPIV